MTRILKTPAHRFDHLKDYPFAPNYLEVEKGLHMHYVNEGTNDEYVFLLLHGEPSWSYLYRHMIPVLAKEHRVVAPDLIGFGKSDKLAEQKAYSYQNHLDWLTALITKLDLTNIVLFCQDWGGLLGLRIITEMPERFSMVVASNTTLPTGYPPLPKSFMAWREFSQKSESFDIARVIDSGTVLPLSKDAYDAYNAPFPAEAYKAGARVFPPLVPASTEDPEAIKNKAAWEKLTQWTKPFLTVFGSEDNIMFGAEKVFQKLIPGAQGQEHKILHAGHFIQEEKGAELAQLTLDFYKKNKLT